MRVKVHYQYQNYPYSERATKLSKSLSLLSTWPIYLVAWLPLYLVAALLLISTVGLTDTLNVIVIVVSWVVSCFLIQKIKQVGQKKVEKIAREDYIEYQQENMHRNTDFSRVGDLFSSSYGGRNS